MKLSSSYQVRIAWKLVNNWVPDWVQIFNTSVVHFWNVFIISTGITFWIVMVNFRNCVKRLVYVAMKMDDESENKGLLVFLIRERRNDLLNIGWGADSWISFEELSEISKSIDNHFRIRLKLREVRTITSFIEISLIDKVPWTLPRVALILDIIGKSCTFSKWVFEFVLGDVWMTRLQCG